jgi:Lon protease-like protein
VLRHGPAAARLGGVDDTVVTDAPLFPLPHGALLPGELLPLHVFEPRYRSMLEAVRRGERIIAIATLLPGWETDYHGQPPVAAVVGLGRMVKDRVNADGTSDIVLHGLLRAEIATEVGGRPWRVARLVVRSEDGLHAAEAFRMRREFLTGLAARLKNSRLRYDLTAGFDAGALADRIASALDLQPDERVAVLQALPPERRVALVLELLSDRDHRKRLLEILPSLQGFSLELDPPRGEHGA